MTTVTPVLINPTFVESATTAEWMTVSSPQIAQKVQQIAKNLRADKVYLQKPIAWNKTRTAVFRFISHNKTIKSRTLNALVND